MGTNTATIRQPGLATPFLVRIIEERMGYYGPRYDLEVMGFGASSSALAKEQAERHLAHLRANPTILYCVKSVSIEPVVSTYRAEFYRGCDRCRVSGIEPGCKRKKCTTCQGVGTIPGHGGE